MKYMQTTVNNPAIQQKKKVLTSVSQTNKKRIGKTKKQQAERVSKAGRKVTRTYR